MRRRVAALVIVLAVVALLVWALTAFARSGSSEDEATETAVPETLVTTPTEPEPSATTTSETETSPAESESEAKPSDENEQDAALADKKNCELSDLRLTVRPNKPSYAADDQKDQPDFTVQIQNPTGGDCEIDTSEEPLRFEVYAIGQEGFQPVWGDTDCHDPVINGREVFPAGESRNFNATWSRLASAPGQCEGRQPVGPGAYVATASLGGNTSEGATFNVG